MSAHWADKAPGWVRHAHIYDAAFAPFTRAVISAADLGPRQRVLDLGCGTGALLEASVTVGAEPVGIDISADMTEAARRRVPTATIVTGDAQTSDILAEAPGVPFDRVVSRFGVMFFSDPVAAFTNILAATAPGGRLAFVCWRSGESDMFWHGLRSLTARLDMPVTAPIEGEPGPMGFAQENRIRNVLADSGWCDARVEPIEGTADFSVDGSDGVEERLSVALAGRIGQAIRSELEPRLGEAAWHAALDEVRAELREHFVDGRVAFPVRTWLVTAVKAGG